jgi:hypothetical protein
MVAGQKQRRPQLGERGKGQQIPQQPIATPAFVVAEVTADQEAVREFPGGTQLLEGLVQPMAQQGQGGAAAAATGWISKQMGVTQLEDPHDPRAGEFPTSLDDSAAPAALAIA